jgi:hypothetical protein
MQQLKYEMASWLGSEIPLQINGQILSEMLEVDRSYKSSVFRLEHIYSIPIEIFVTIHFFSTNLTICLIQKIIQMCKRISQV